MKYRVVTKRILHQLKVSAKYNGFSYVIYSMILFDQDYSYTDSITKSLYVDIGKRFGVSKYCVEKSIRKIINVIWDNLENINREILISIFGVHYKVDKPSNKEFLLQLFYYVELCLYYDGTPCPTSGKPCVMYPECQWSMDMHKGVCLFDYHYDGR